MSKTKKNTVLSFSSFDEASVKQAFKLTYLLDAKELLKDWMEKAKAVVIEKVVQENLNAISYKSRIYARNLNEQELRDKIIAPLLALVDFDDYDLEIGAFSERGLGVTIKDTTIEGKVDWMVASGQFKPRSPFFFLHEYKKEKEAANDPVGQLLVTMYVAKCLNEKEEAPSLLNPKPLTYHNAPLYGCYVVGKFWYFVRLKDNVYGISKPYNSTNQEQLYDIYRLLVAQKQMIIDFVNNNKV